MEEIRQIESLQNPRIKQLILLKEKSRWRKKTGEFVVEGQREIGMAVKGGIALQSLLYCPEIVETEQALALVQDLTDPPELVALSKSIYQRIAYREKTEGVLAVGQSKSHGLEELIWRREQPLILIAESPEKPGNLGALLRTADAARLDAVIVADPVTDLYNPNVIRSSMGCIFTTPVAVASSEAVIDFLSAKGIAIYAAELEAAVNYSSADFKRASAIAVGTESTGLTELWKQAAESRIIIPMLGEIDSMNLSVSAAILIFEAMRQREFH